MPWLHTLKLGSSSTDRHFAPLERFLDAQRLHAVHIISLAYRSSLLLSWTQLTRLVLETMAVDDCAANLIKTVNLVHCTLRGIHMHHAFAEMVNPLTRLESPKVLGCLTLPALRSVEIGGINVFFDLYSLDRLQACVARSGYNLEHLHLIVERAPADFSMADRCRAMFSSVSTFLLTGEGS
ncbi:hypothetical protein K438DRAFT_90579 [Mycena galopus ATCC 62051]|nr:hypothetical protein K438DRAFT_90579 [Mycena galopus ATCC 62051]